VRRRAPWLAALLILEGFTTNVMSHYEEFIAGMLILTFFVPTLVSVGGNAGAQISALIIRGMSIGELSKKDIWKIVGREAITGLIIAIILGILLSLRVLLVEPRWDIALAVGIALTIVVWYSNMIGALLPMMAKKIGVDPAVMAGPMVTTIVDVTGIAMYFAIVKLILP
jgi:magnesium transporter